LVPSTVSPGLAPCEAARHSRLGSALRLSQPLSGFLAHPSFVALFRATTVPGIPPFRGFPSQEIAGPSRGSLAPLQLSTCVRSRTTFDRSPAVSPTSTRWRGCLVPPKAMSSLSSRRGESPGHSDLGSRARSLPRASPASKLRSLPRVRSRSGRVSSRRSVDPLLGFCPSRVFLS
jgi:hypothetical protein